ncbi:MAG: hypothetical protein SFX18_07860, partial [Pirellulales bacterium]|nr:hypothetical protein [Pirellulales bacterium]
PSGRHRSGWALRFPRIARWRTDKTASQADTLESLVRLYEQAQRAEGNQAKVDAHGSTDPREITEQGQGGRLTAKKPGPGTASAETTEGNKPAWSQQSFWEGEVN